MGLGQVSSHLAGQPILTDRLLPAPVISFRRTRDCIGVRAYSINQSCHGLSGAAMDQPVLPWSNQWCHGSTGAAMDQPVVPWFNQWCHGAASSPTSFVQAFFHEMGLEEDSRQPTNFFDAGFLEVISLRTICPAQFSLLKPIDLERCEILFSVVLAKAKFIHCITKKPTLTQPESKILAYGYHKKYCLVDGEPARIEWFFSHGNASTSCTCLDASTPCSACKDAFPLLALILAAQEYTDILSLIVALPTDLLQQLLAFVRDLPCSVGIRACLQGISGKKPDGTCPKTNGIDAPFSNKIT